ncbi:MAG: ATP-dependent DNA helicase RecG [Alphaproteobacteria bacterium]|nr:ATP-dependent DNA helicase RecG [Alphaproteobacteria bacterium]
MRPEVLFPLFAPVRTLPGVGPRMGEKFAKIAGERVLDVLWLKPAGYVDRRLKTALVEVPEGSVATLKLHVLSHQPSPPRSRAPYRILCSDETGVVELVYFGGHNDYLAKLLPEGALRIVSGRIERHDGRLQMAHPDYVVAPDQANQIPEIEPVYPLTEGLTNKAVSKAARGALVVAPDLTEWQDTAWVSKQHWPSWWEALNAIHAPPRVDEQASERARRRLAYDEVLANQLALMLIRTRMKKVAGRVLQGDGVLRARLKDALPFDLTRAQIRTGREIADDLKSGHRMLRLVQGDVGAGKTLVALEAMLLAVEAGAQAALMAPTELLARQHFATIAPLAERIGIRSEVLTGREKGRLRTAILDDLRAGKIHILIGTHALFTEDVGFDDLALAVVDEQHKFGVSQRLSLSGKGGRPAHVLVMTATPIPRTLALTAYGDMEVSKLDEKPPGRQDITTRAVPLGRLEEVEQAVARAIGQGDRVYWVCPLIEQNEKLDVAAAESRYRELEKRFGIDRVALAHGKMKQSERDAAMARFRSGAASVLVATTVIEVGVDVPEATVMIVEHAERFGLAQLHQLRGRVGRGARPSSCLLLYQDDPPLGDAAKARLKIMRETNDGFIIAEEDLRLRGPGEVLGTRQSGMPEMHFADLFRDADLLSVANDDARLVISRDTELTTPRGEALRRLLYLFERDEAVRYLRSG